MRKLRNIFVVCCLAMFLCPTYMSAQDIRINLSRKNKDDNAGRNILVGDNLNYLQQVGENLVDVEDNLRKSVEFIADPIHQGRAAGSTGERQVADYIYQQLVKFGVTMLVPEEGEDFFIAQNDTLHSRNIIGIIEGYDPLLKNEYVVIGANYDNIGTNEVIVDGVPQLQIYPGANANASGCAALLEIAKEAQKENFMFRRSVIIAFFGADAQSTYGSWYFVNRAFPEVENIVGMINLSMIGKCDIEDGIYAYLGGGNAELKAIVNYISNRPLSIVPTVSPIDFAPAAHRNFYQKGIPVISLTGGRSKEYHTVKDTPDKLDYSKILKTGEFAYCILLMLANIDERLNVTQENQDKGANNSSERIYTQNEVDEKATFLHGDEVQFLKRWVYQYLKYPQSAIDEGIQGTVIVTFTVDKEGKVKDVTVTKSVSEELDEEAVKVISVSPKWKPGKLEGEKVSVKISIPVEFKLTKHSKFKLKK